jgi:hypothetical protein
MIVNDFILSCCSTADLSVSHYEKRNIKTIPFHFSLDGVEYLDDGSMPIDKFYKEMAAGKMTSTSQVNVEEYENYFEEFLKDGKDILHLTLSSGISGTYNSAMLAKDELSEKYPDRKIFIVDSLAASSGYGLLMDKLADIKDEGRTIEEVRDFAIENRLRLNHWFFSTDLTYYVRGGRISKAEGFIGNVLGICPLLYVNKGGKLKPYEKVRTKKRVYRRMVEMMEKLADDGTDYSDKCYLSMSACIDDAQQVALLIEDKFKKIKDKILINNIGTTIGSHTGPGTVALFFWGKERGE